MFKQLLILFLVFNTISLHGQWKYLGSNNYPGTPGDMIFHVHALNKNVVWGLLFQAATYAPTQTYFKTTDGGTTITTHEFDVEDNSLTAFGIHALDENTAWVAMTSEPCQCYGQVYKTEDGGASWQKKFTENSEQSIVGVYFWDANEGFAIGSNGTGNNTDQSAFYRTSDGGETWEETTSSLIQPGEGHWLASGNSVFEVVNDHVFFGTRHGRVFKSADRGMTWEVSLQLENSSTISDVAFQDELNGIAVSAMASNGFPQSNSGWKTTDGGLSWTAIDIPQFVPAYTIEYIPDTDGSYVITGGWSNPGNMIVTRTHGAYWTFVKSPRVIGLAFLSPTVVFAGSTIQNGQTGGLIKLVSSFADDQVNVKTIVGNRLEGFEINEPLKSNLYNPKGMEMDNEGNIYIANVDGNNILKLSADGSELTNFAGTPGFPNDVNVDTLSDDSFNGPSDVAIDGDGNLYVADFYNNQIKMITPTGEVSVYAGTGENGDSDGNIETASFAGPVALCFDSNKNLLVGEFYKIRKISPDGIVTTIAGSGMPGSMDGVGSAVSFNFIWGMDIDDEDNLFVTDFVNSKVRKINPTGVVTTIAGTGTFGYLDGPGNVAQFYGPEGIAVDAYNNIYVGDGLNGFIRKIDSLGNVTSVAGIFYNAYTAGPDAPGPQIQDGDGSSAIFSRSRGLFAKPNGDLLHTEWGGDVIREIQFGVPAPAISVNKIIYESQNISHIDHVGDFSFAGNIKNTSADIVENVGLHVLVWAGSVIVFDELQTTDVIEVGETNFFPIDESFTPPFAETFYVEFNYYVNEEKIISIDDKIIVSDSVMGYDDYYPFAVTSYDFIAGWDNGFGMAHQLNQPDTITGMELFLGLDSGSVVNFAVFEVTAFGLGELVYKSAPVAFDEEFYGTYQHKIPPIAVDAGKYLFVIKGMENLVAIGFDNDHLSNQLWIYYDNAWGRVNDILGGYVEQAAMIRPILGSVPTIVNTQEINEISIDVFPNPFASSITINQDQPEELTISLFDISGKLMLEKISNNEIIQLNNLTHLPTGPYMVRVNGENFIKDVPVVKIKN